MAGEFAQNRRFLEFLLLAKTDPKLRSSLRAGKTLAISRFPGLSPAERTGLKMVDWKHTVITIAAHDLDSFRPGKPGISKEWCTESVGPKAVTKTCYK
jgi:hypothetical protein